MTCLRNAAAGLAVAAVITLIAVDHHHWRRWTVKSHRRVEDRTTP